MIVKHLCCGVPLLLLSLNALVWVAFPPFRVEEACKVQFVAVLHVVHIFILRWFYVLDHLKARNHADRHRIFVCVFSITIFGASQRLGFWYKKHQKKKLKKNQTKPPKHSQNKPKQPTKTKKTSRNVVCLCRLSSCSTQTNNGLCLLVMNVSILVSILFWGGCNWLLFLVVVVLGFFNFRSKHYNLFLHYLLI